MRRVIDRHHARAQRDGTRIVPFCGFDSVPSDLGALLVVRHIEAELDAPCVEVKGYFRMMGGFNGGTLATNAHSYETGEAEAGRDPFLLNPRAQHSAADLVRNQDPRDARYDSAIGAWVAPFIMGFINTRVVRRSAALMSAYKTPYGPRFRYQEYSTFGGPLGAAKATALAVGLRGFDHAMKRGSARALLARLLPAPGQGPSELAMARGWFRTDLIGRTADGRTARARIGYSGDPGNRRRCASCARPASRWPSTGRSCRVRRIVVAC